MMSRFVERVLNSPRARCQSAEQVSLQMSSERQGGESCGSQGLAISERFRDKELIYKAPYKVICLLWYSLINIF